MLRLLKNSIRFAVSPYATNLKRANAVRALWSWRVTRSADVRHYPHTLVVCPGTVCNLRCALCPTGQAAAGRQRGLMDMACFSKVMDECGPYLFAVELYNWGEPLMNPRIFDMVRYAKRFQVEVRISTNLNRFDEAICDEMIASGLDLLTVSLYGASQESAGRYHVGVNYEATLANMETIVRTRKALGKTAPLVRWLFLPNRYNEREIGQAQQTARRLGIDAFFCFARFRCDMGKELLMPQARQFDNVSAWLPSDDSLSFYSLRRRERKAVPESCKWLWTRSTVNWDGSVSPCDGVWEEKYDFGNVLDQAFFKIWNGPKYQEARRLTTGRGSASADLICTICHDNRAILEW